MDVEESNVLDKFANYGPRGFQTDIDVFNRGPNAQFSAHDSGLEMKHLRNRCPAHRCCTMCSSVSECFAQYNLRNQGRQFWTRAQAAFHSPPGGGGAGIRKWPNMMEWQNETICDCNPRFFVTCEIFEFYSSLDPSLGLTDQRRILSLVDKKNKITYSLTNLKEPHLKEGETECKGHRLVKLGGLWFALVELPLWLSQKLMA